MRALPQRPPRVVSHPETPIIEGRPEMTDDWYVKDKSYQASPIGDQVRRWLAALEYEDVPTTTRDSYELTGARLALEFDRLDGLHELSERGGEGVGMCSYFLAKYWGDCSAAARTRRRPLRWSLIAGAVA